VASAVRKNRRMATVLLVEDDDIFRHAAALHLDRAGFEVIAAAHSTAALGELGSGRAIDFAVIDMVMPQGHIHGLALARLARLRHPGLPIAFITGNPEVAQAEGIGGAVFVKPVDLQQLTNEIATRLTVFDEMVETRLLAVLDDHPNGISVAGLAAECRRRGWAADGFSGDRLAALLGVAPDDIIRRDADKKN
jgi:DNA-binding NtrC family response regulator